jgi:hypothetical protein
LPLSQLLALLVVHHGMAMEEGAAAAIFTRNTHPVALDKHGCVSEVLAHAPIHRCVPCAHGQTIIDDLLNARMQRESFRHGCQANGQTRQLFFGTRVSHSSV